MERGSRIMLEPSSVPAGSLSGERPSRGCADAQHAGESCSREAGVIEVNIIDETSPAAAVEQRLGYRPARRVATRLLVDDKLKPECTRPAA
jgi:hypothetical protein